MSTPLPSFPDIEAALLDLLAPLVATGHVGTTTPTDLAGTLPFIRLDVFSGTDDLITDTSRVAVDVFAAKRSDGIPLAEQVRQTIIAYPHVIGSVIIDRAGTLTRPAETPWDGTGVRRWSATYTVSARR